MRNKPICPLVPEQIHYEGGPLTFCPFIPGFRGQKSVLIYEACLVIT